LLGNRRKSLIKDRDKVCHPGGYGDTKSGRIRQFGCDFNMMYLLDLELIGYNDLLA
jgi:hypothetical protein